MSIDLVQPLVAVGISAPEACELAAYPAAENRTALAEALRLIASLKNDREALDIVGIALEEVAVRR